jgi:hypothetical protein
MIAIACTATTPAPTLTPQPIQTGAPTTITPRPPTATPQPTGAPTLSSSPTRTATTSPTPAPSAAQTVYPAGSAIVTFDVDGEQYRILVVDPQNVAIARKLLAGQEAPSIPNGLIVRGDPSVNTGWSWHIDPQSLEFADMTTEVCDGKPSFVEAGTLTGDRFCPWSARVVAIEPVNQ